MNTDGQDDQDGKKRRVVIKGRSTGRRETPAWVWLFMVLVVLGAVMLLADYWAMRNRFR